MHQTLDGQCEQKPRAWNDIENLFCCERADCQIWTQAIKLMMMIAYNEDYHELNPMRKRIQETESKSNV